MPIAQLHFLEGRSDDQKAALIAAVTDAFVETLGADRTGVIVTLHELPGTQWGKGGAPLSPSSTGGSV